MIADEEILELEVLLQFEEAGKCVDDFYRFCVYMDEVFFTEKKQYLRDIAIALQEVESGGIKKLMISLPPRAGKSYISSLFCAWLIGKHPDGSIMRNSYAAELAEKFSYDIREIIKSDKYLVIFPDVKLRSDKHAVNDWAITKSKQSTYFCSGVGGAITGKGCNLVAILDDPIKNVEDALSETILTKTWQWYTSTHKSRVEKNCPEIHIATRWSQRDPIGMLLKETDEDWTTIIVPALKENGETFCDEIKTTEEYLELKKITDDFIWEAEFMQNPIEAKGLLFLGLKRFTLNEIEKYENPNMPERWDGILNYTDTADEGTDYLASVTGKVKGRYLFITDVVFTQESIEVTEPMVSQMLIETKCDKAVVESNSGGKSFAKNVRALIQNVSNCIIKWRANTQNKETRILMKSGQVKEYFRFREDYEIGSDYDKFMRQLTSYVKMGKNKHDDAADAITGLAEEFFKSSSLEILR